MERLFIVYGLIMLGIIIGFLITLKGKNKMAKKKKETVKQNPPTKRNAPAKMGEMQKRQLERFNENKKCLESDAELETRYEAEFTALKQRLVGNLIGENETLKAELAKKGIGV